MIVIGGTFPINPEKREEALALVNEIVTATKKEAGCTKYDFYTLIGDPNTFLVFEEWVDQAALDAHFQTPHLQKFLASIPAMLSGKLDLKRYVVESATAL